jgi:NitT/TauT family transport system permease protein
MPADTAVDHEPALGQELAGLDVLELGGERQTSRARRIWSATWPKLLAVAITLFLWQMIVWSGWKTDFQLAPPSKVFPQLWEDIQDGTMGTAIRITAQRMALGYFLALVIGVLIGAAVSRSRILRSGVGSMITGLQTMPSVAWFPLAILLFGTSEAAILFVVVLGAAPSIANGLIGGIDTVPPLYIRAGRVLGARGFSMWRHVMLPAALPSFLGGLKQGWAFAWRSLMAGELLVIIPGQASLGVLLQTGRDLSDSARLLSAMVVILFIGILVDAVVFGAADRAVRRRWGLLQPS